MKKALVFLAVMLVTSLPAMAHAAWSCTAESNYAHGYSTNYQTEWQARQRALQECAIRTPYYDTCYIVRCWWR